MEDEEDFEEFQTAAQNLSFTPKTTDDLQPDSTPVGAPANLHIDFDAEDKQSVSVPRLFSGGNFSQEVSSITHLSSERKTSVEQLLQETVDEVVRSCEIDSEICVQTPILPDSKTASESFTSFASSPLENSNSHASPTEENDDDFGDFDQADFAQDGFANFDSEVFPTPVMISSSVHPVTLESFRTLIGQLFSDRETCAAQSVETETFQASIERDFARCENVDDWECVVFRFESSNTRKALLAALCIDETPANIPRFALDCLRNDFLQPEKVSVPPGNAPAEKGSNAPKAPESTGQSELSDCAKDVLAKIPDLSFMKAEVLTFPSVNVQAAP